MEAVSQPSSSDRDSTESLRQRIEDGMTVGGTFYIHSELCDLLGQAETNLTGSARPTVLLDTETALALVDLASAPRETDLTVVTQIAASSALGRIA